MCGMRTFAAGCSTSNSRRMVAPSLVMVTSPMSSTSIWATCSCQRHSLGSDHCCGANMRAQCAGNWRLALSRPTGPSELFTMFAIAATAVTFCVLMSSPVVRSPCSCSAGPPPPNMLPLAILCSVLRLSGFLSGAGAELQEVKALLCAELPPSYPNSQYTTNRVCFASHFPTYQRMRTLRRVALEAHAHRRPLCCPRGSHKSASALSQPPRTQGGPGCTYGCRTCARGVRALGAGLHLLYFATIQRQALFLL